MLGSNPPRPPPVRPADRFHRDRLRAGRRRHGPRPRPAARCAPACLEAARRPAARQRADPPAADLRPVRLPMPARRQAPAPFRAVHPVRLLCCGRQGRHRSPAPRQRRPVCHHAGEARAAGAGRGRLAVTQSHATRLRRWRVSQCTRRLRRQRRASRRLGRGHLAVLSATCPPRWRGASRPRGPRPPRPNPLAHLPAAVVGS